MKKILAVSLWLLAEMVGLAQPITLTFTGRDASTGEHVSLTSIVISDVTLGWTDTLYYPDTVAVLHNVLATVENASQPVFGLSQNSPNPFSGCTDVMLTVTEPGPVTWNIADVNGRTVATTHSSPLQSGTHQFRIHLANAGIYFLSAQQNGKSAAVKMVCNGSGSKNSIALVGTVEPAFSGPEQKNEVRGQIGHLFFSGDGMTFKGFGERNGVDIVSEVIEKRVDADETIVFDLDTIVVIVPTDGRPCSGTPTLTDVDGNIYNTVRIGNQCWMKENLKTTRYADSTAIALGTEQSEQIAYRYYPDGDSNWVAAGGYLYNWIAVMHEYAFTETAPDTVQGICPNGWHVPSHAEWTELGSYVRSRNDCWCDGDHYNTGKAMADSIGWLPCEIPCAPGYDPSSNNASGFSAYPIGVFSVAPYHTRPGEGVSFWSSKERDSNRAYYHQLNFESTVLSESHDRKYMGFSIRCVRNE